MNAPHNRHDIVQTYGYAILAIDSNFRRIGKMNIALKLEQENFIRAKLQGGNYQSVDSLLAFAFQLLEEYETKQQKLSELRKKIAEGTEQIKQGDVVDGELVFQQLQTKLEQMSQK
jgi:antitoxin ParD1/3/4